MKRLHKKIGVGVLVAGLLMGGASGLGGSVAHADSSVSSCSSDSYLQVLLGGIKNERGKVILKQIFELGEKCGKFYVIEASENGGDIRLDAGKINKKINSKRKSDIHKIKEQISGREFKKGSIVQLHFRGVGLRLLLAYY